MGNGASAGCERLAVGRCSASPARSEGPDSWLLSNGDDGEGREDGRHAAERVGDCS